MIYIGVDHFFAYTMPWLKMSTSTYKDQMYELPSGDFGNAIDDQVLAEILLLTEVI